MRMFLIIFSFLMLVLAGLWSSGFRYNYTPSMPSGIYLITGGLLQRNDSVSYCLPAGLYHDLATQRGYLQPGSCATGRQPLLKTVRALSGDSISLTEDGITVNGRLLKNSNPVVQDKNGLPLPSLLQDGIVPDGYALLLSDQHTGGFDSRYFGLVKVSDVQKVVLLYGWGE